MAYFDFFSYFGHCQNSSLPSAAKTKETLLPPLQRCGHDTRRRAFHEVKCVRRNGRVLSGWTEL
jgi:hypothetical protein